jgi:hypothetical protein
MGENVMSFLNRPLAHGRRRLSDFDLHRRWRYTPMSALLPPIVITTSMK